MMRPLRRALRPRNPVAGQPAADRLRKPNDVAFAFSLLSGFAFSLLSTTVEFLPFGLNWTRVAEIRFSENKDLPDDNDLPRR